MTPSPPADVRATVDRIMVDVFECDPAQLAPEARLGPDLGLDSLDGVDLVVALEKAFQVRISEEVAKGIKTLGDIYAQIEGRRGGGA